MKTDDLIARLARESPQPSQRLLKKTILMLGAIALPSGIFLHMAGMRPDIMDAQNEPFVLLGTVLFMAVCGLSASLLLRLSRPEAPVWIAVIVILAVFVVAILVWVAAILMRTSSTVNAVVDPQQAVQAILSILILSTIPAFASVNLAKTGATSFPVVSAALAGLTSATGAAAGYSLHFSFRDPSIFVVCNSLAILIVTATTVRFGAKVLRW